MIYRRTKHLASGQLDKTLWVEVERLIERDTWASVQIGVEQAVGRSINRIKLNK